MDSMDTIRLFTPYYINQSRLFDLYSILNHGYSEYEEITVQDDSSKKSAGKAEVAASSGFKLIKISGGIEGTLEQQTGYSSGVKTKRVQTVASILGTVLDEMENKKLIKTLQGCCQGAFFNEAMSFQLNSIKKLLDILKEIADLSSSMASIGVTAKLPYTKKQIDDIKKAFALLFGGLEVFYEADDYAVIANISEKSIYLSNLEDIVNTEIQCFGQVKKIHPEGTKLLKNTTFSKLKSAESKHKFIDSIAGFANNDTLDLDITARAEITGKTVYEVEIISLCK